ncbi:MAG: polyphosphate kinase 1 [Armatimonadota bacterium]
MPATPPTPEPVLDLHDPSLYINRELSWLEFNHRVLEEALEHDKPLLERLKFLSIVSSNLDEFFMVRVAGLKRQVRSQRMQRGAEGLAAEEQLRRIAERCHLLVREQDRCLNEEILPGLAEHGIEIKQIEQLTPEQARWVKDYFHRQVFPVLTPLGIDPSHPFPQLRNRSLNLVVTLRKGRPAPGGWTSPLYLAVVQVPTGIPRLVQLPAEKGVQFVLLEDVICAQISELFQGLTVTGCYPFRITRDSDLEFDEEEAEDLLEQIEQELRKREWGDTVRLEVTKSCGPRAMEELLQALEITEQDVYCRAAPLNQTDFMALYRLPDYAHLKDAPFVAPEVRPVQGETDLFAVLREQDVLIHHPYESFNTVVKFVEQAADDPDVLAIKQTLYRTSGDSPLVAALTRAAENGKQVTAIVELKARFDEENNIGWARRLERSGVHVVYGLMGLKIHCKLLLVVRREPGEDRLRRYVHLGTGNYNPSTARLYTDLGLLTSSLRIGQDVSRLFNVLTGYSEFPKWRRLAVSPLGLRERVVELIEREAEHARKGRQGRIIAQMNSLVDPEAIRALYRASQAGVSIDLIVRGVCCLRAQVPGVSDNIRVRSIVGRDLEHRRIFYFRSGGEEEVYLASADWMPRNFLRRVEVMFPVEDPALRRRVAEMLHLALRDNVNARQLCADGRYVPVKPKRGQNRLDSQLAFRDRALREHATPRERALGTDLLVRDLSHPGGPEHVALTALFPVRNTPPELPHEPVHPPDPVPPNGSRNGHAGVNGAGTPYVPEQEAEEALYDDASGV